MSKKKEWIPGEDTRLAPFDRPRSEERAMTNDDYVSLFATDSELKELRKKIEARRFPAKPSRN